MLTSVANYLFGSSQSEEPNEPSVDLETTPADADKDWLLVDLPDGWFNIYLFIHHYMYIHEYVS